MTNRIHVTITADLFVEDEKAMREAAFSRLREAFHSDDDFPYDSAADISLDQVLHSLLADAIPAGLPGCRRSQLDVESEVVGPDVDVDTTSHDSAGGGETSDSAAAADEQDGDTASVTDDGATGDSNGDDNGHDSPTDDAPSNDTSTEDDSGDDAPSNDTSTDDDSSDDRSTERS